MHKETTLPVVPETHEPTPEELEAIAQAEAHTVADAVLQDGTSAFSVDTRLELSDDIRTIIRAQMGKRAKKITIMGNTFVFLCANRADWEESVDSWRQRMQDQGNPVTDDVFDRNLIDSFVIFPSVGLGFDMPAQDTVYWNSLPAGVQPRLANQIQHYAGFIVPELLKDEEFQVEDLFLDDEIVERPSDEVIAEIKASTDMPCRLVRFYQSWYIIRAMRWSEARHTRKRILEDPNGDHEIRQLQKVVLLGPTDFDKQPAGLVPMLLAHMRQVSGLPLGDEPILHEEAEDL